MLDITQYRDNKNIRFNKLGLLHKILFTSNLFRMTSRTCHTHQVNVNVALCCWHGYVLYTCLAKTDCRYVQGRIQTGATDANASVRIVIFKLRQTQTDITHF